MELYREHYIVFQAPPPKHSFLSDSEIIQPKRLSRWLTGKKSGVFLLLLLFFLTCRNSGTFRSRRITAVLCIDAVKPLRLSLTGYDVIVLALGAPYVTATLSSVLHTSVFYRFSLTLVFSFPPPRLLVSWLCCFSTLLIAPGSLLLPAAFLGPKPNTHVQGWVCVCEWESEQVCVFGVHLWAGFFFLFSGRCSLVWEIRITVLEVIRERICMHVHMETHTHKHTQAQSEVRTERSSFTRHSRARGTFKDYSFQADAKEWGFELWEEKRGDKVLLECCVCVCVNFIPATDPCFCLINTWMRWIYRIIGMILVLVGNSRFGCTSLFCLFFLSILKSFCKQTALHMLQISKTISYEPRKPGYFYDFCLFYCTFFCLDFRLDINS